MAKSAAKRKTATPAKKSRLPRQAAAPAPQSDGANNAAEAPRITATLKAYFDLKRAIHASELTPGKTYPQENLAKQLAISRTPLREAAIRLHSEGLVEVRPRRGVYIRPITHLELVQVFDLLTALASLGARRAAEVGVTPDVIASLHEVHARMEQAARENDAKTWFETDRTFHNEIVKASGNDYLFTMVQALWERLNRAWLAIIGLRTIARSSSQEHLDLIALLCQRNGDRAFDLHFKHYSGAREPMLALLTSNGIEHL